MLSSEALLDDREYGDRIRRNCCRLARIQMGELGGRAHMAHPLGSTVWSLQDDHTRWFIAHTHRAVLYKCMLGAKSVTTGLAVHKPTRLQNVR